ncbi:hypothetical protein FE257_013018 [Aspergillus nanangensis]|uniref:Zn(2)-C6 fungal-type domain-containing protein n=1 Tax=Aspergillus nanangensis TaxID=2582783 RepID=A0AAD4CF08_ASPNN|nr:hypothetical protein FE257_013018 [Aspergillus nanangensis]
MDFSSSASHAGSHTGSEGLDMLASDAEYRNKQPTSSVSVYYPRKRAVRACQVCRARRTKCDNKKPACSFCEKIGAKCVVTDPSDLSAFDPASLVIIKRLDQIELLLQQQKQHQQQQQQQQLQRRDRDSADGVSPTSIKSSPAVVDSGSVFDNPLYYSGGVEVSQLTVETILSWSVFQGKFASRTNLKSLLKSPTSCGPEPFFGTSDPRLERLDLDVNTCTRLLHIFLEQVHIANPILDVPVVTNYVYQACVHEIGWDAPSCLVLLICALGAISESFQEDHQANSLMMRRSPSFHLGQKYFEAAQMRLGAVLRTHGVLEAQCFFYSGVYLMAVFQPIRAWRCFVQTAAMSETMVFNEGSVQSDLRYIKTTHWTCLKSELELRLELGLNQSNPHGYTYPAFFPSLPMEQLNTDDSRMWYFYLAETAVRRLTMRIIQMFFQNQRDGRFPEAHQMIESSLDFEIQAAEW